MTRGGQSILAGDGTQFVCNDSSLTGIGSTRFSPDGLTEIQPGGTAKVSITYQQAGWGTGTRVPNNIISFTWQANVIVNQNYQVSDYDNSSRSLTHCRRIARRRMYLSTFNCRETNKIFLRKISRLIAAMIYFQRKFRTSVGGTRFSRER